MIFGVSISSLLLRILRGAVVAMGTFYLQQHANMSVHDFLTTGAAGGAAMGLAKFLRDKFPGWFEWLPV